MIAAPYTDSSNKFGYVFNNCTIENKAASFSFGRSWGGLSKLTYLNTTINQPNEVIDTRFTLNGMNVAAYSFKEYNSMDKDGNVVSPASLVETFTHNNGNYTYDIILSAEEAAEYTLDKVFPDWKPAEVTVQAPAPTYVKLEGTTLSWDDNNPAALWAIVKNGKVVDFTTEADYTVDDAEADYAVRAANAMGGLSETVVANAFATVVLADAGYATFFDSENTYQLPAGLKAYTVTAANTSALTYAEVENLIPAGTAVMLESADHVGGEYYLPVSSKEAAYDGANLLHGSDVATMTFADGQNLFYKLAYGNSQTAQAASFGWFWGAEAGAAFQIEGHRAWLAIPQQAAAPNYIIGATTGISTVAAEQATDGQFYNLHGQRVNAPVKGGLYIHNNKKVIIK